MRKTILFFLSTLLLSACMENNIQEECEDEAYVQQETRDYYGFPSSTYSVDSGFVKRDEGLIHILPAFGIDYVSIVTAAENFKNVFDVRSIKPGKPYFIITPIDTLKQEKHFVYVKDPIEYVVFSFTDSVDVRLHKKPVTLKEKESSGFITSSLWSSFIDQGLNPALFAEVVRLYQWTIDFFDVKDGDSFRVIYDEKFVEDESVGIGNIKAILFNHKEHDYYAFRYDIEDKDFVYYTEKGESLKRLLLSAPLEYRRISSRFSNRRFHPVLKYYRPHHGVDYAAPRGTPVVSTGSGTVTFAGRSGGAGNMVKIRHHAGDIETRYLHLNRFAPGIRKGAKVSQGQKIGEVGSTGLSTGPHLDYRVYIRGKAVNPLGIDIPTADPLSGDSLQVYLETIATIKDQIDKMTLLEQSASQSDSTDIELELSSLE